MSAATLLANEVKIAVRIIVILPILDVLGAISVIAASRNSFGASPRILGHSSTRVVVVHTLGWINRINQLVLIIANYFFWK